MATGVDSEGRPVNPTDVFSVDTKAFYCSLKLSHFPPGTEIKAEWILMAGQAAVGLSDNTTLQTNIGHPEGDGYTYIVLESTGYAGVKWPRGEYKVVFSVGDVEKASVSFRVE